MLMKSLIFIVVSVVVCGVSWFHTGTLTDSDVFKNAIDSSLVESSDKASSPSAKKTDSGQVDIVHEVSNNHIGSTREELLEEYWTDLTPNFAPSQMRLLPD